MSKLIYIADDDVNIRKLVRSFLERVGYTVETFPDGEMLLERFRKKESDLVILDVMMPGRDGFLITEPIRRESRVPIIMLTARDTETDLVLGIQMGSDDYLSKPFSPTTLNMKVRVLFRRIELDQGSPRREELVFEDIKILPEQKRVTVADQEVDLAPNKFSLLEYLMMNQDRAVSRAELLDKVWGYTVAVETRVTDDTLKCLRRKIRGSSVIIETVWGFGFRLKKQGLKDD